VKVSNDKEIKKFFANAQAAEFLNIKTLLLYSGIIKKCFGIVFSFTPALIILNILLKANNP
jgi:hypothetical protein